MSNTDPIPLPVIRQVILRASSFFVTPVPDQPGRFNWSCEDCAAGGDAVTAAELGAGIASHTESCTG